MAYYFNFEMALKSTDTLGPITNFNCFTDTIQEAQLQITDSTFQKNSLL